MIDNFADTQVLPRKVLNMDETFQKFMNKSLSAQLANGLRDPNHAISARAIIKKNTEILFADFRSDLAMVLGVELTLLVARVYPAMPFQAMNHLRHQYQQRGERKIKRMIT